MSARDGANALPLGLQRLNLGGRLDPVCRVGERLGSLAQCLLAGQVCDALFVLRREVCGGPREHLVLRRLEPPPHDLALRPRRQGHGLPARLQFAHPAPGDIEVLFRLERLHLLADFFLHLEVGPALPLVGVAQFLQARREGGSRGLEPRQDLLTILLRRERHALLHRRANLTQRAITCLEGDLLGRRKRLDLTTQLLQTPQVILFDLRARLLILELFLLEGGDRALEPLGSRHIRRGVLTEHVGITAQPAPPRDNFLDWLIGRQQLFELRRQRLEPAGRSLGEHTTPFAVLEHARGILESARQRRGVFRRHRRQAIPPHAQLRNPIERFRSGQLLDLGDDGDTVGLLAGNGGRALLFGRTLLTTDINRFAHGLAGRVEPLHERRVDFDVGLQFGPRESHVGQR